MPRETIHQDNPSREGDGPRFDMVVGWNRDMDVQVGITTPSEQDGQYHLIDVLYGDDTEAIGRAVWESVMDRLHGKGARPSVAAGADLDEDIARAVGRDVLNAVTGANAAGGVSLWWHPTRAMINRLIRSLRKARDAAYGRDE